MTTAEAAARLAAMDQVLILTHVRPDGDTIGSAAALCCGLRALGKTAYLLPNPELTATYAPYAAPYLAEADFVPAYVVSVDIAALSLLPENPGPIHTAGQQMRSLLRPPALFAGIPLASRIRCTQA